MEAACSGTARNNYPIIYDLTIRLGHSQMSNLLNWPHWVVDLVEENDHDYRISAHLLNPPTSCTLCGTVGDLRPYGVREQRFVELRQLADELDARAAALRHDRERGPAKRLSTGDHIKRGPGRQPADFIRIERIAPPARRGDSRDANMVEAQERRHGPQRLKLRLYIGKALYRLPAFDEPPYISFARHGQQIAIVPQAEPGDGHYRVVVMGGIPRTWIDSARELFRDLPDGRYVGALVDGRLIIGASIE